MQMCLLILVNHVIPLVKTVKDLLTHNASVVFKEVICSMENVWLNVLMVTMLQHNYSV